MSEITWENEKYAPEDIKKEDVREQSLGEKTADMDYITNKVIQNSRIEGSTLIIGKGDSVLRFDPRYGLWAGDADYDNAPFKVAISDGDLTAGAGTFSGTVQWSAVNDDDGNKPEDNATQGATFGTDISGGGSANNQVSNAGYSTRYLRQVFGDGSDGNVTINSNTTLTADMYYNNLTIDSGYTLNTGGYRVFVRGTLTNNGTISRAGNNGEDGDYNSGDSADGGQALSAGTLGGSTGGGSGGTSGGGSGGDADPAEGGNGGDGGDSAYVGGSGGTATSASIGVRNIPFCLHLYEFSSSSKIKGGCGGGGGGGQGTESIGGGGGGGGGVMVLVAREIDNNSTITVNGGDGGDGSDITTEQGGGGGGGGGGVIVMVYNDIDDSGSITDNGGSGGVGSNGANNGSSGSNGLTIQLEV